VLVDTPGVFTPNRRLDRAMVSAAWAGAADADAVVHIVDAQAAAGSGDEKTREDVERVIEGLRDQSRKALLALNKVDRVEKSALLALAQDFFDKGVYEAVFMIAATTGSGVDALAEALVARMPEGPWHYPEDQIADVPLRLLAAETTREKLFLRLHDELPYALTVETEAWKTLKDGSVRIEQTIFVQREAHKKIVLGRGGQTVKAIGASAREALEAFLDTRVHLFLFVKVRENWMNDPERYAHMGLDYQA
ncbi:MAG: GTPase Era, partial [Maricaulaceae bacterium]